MVVSGLLCGMNTFSEIEEFCKLQTDWPRKWIKLPSGIPRAQTFSNVFSIIDPKEFNQCLMDHLEGLPIEIKQQIVAIDGKCLRGIAYNCCRIILMKQRSEKRRLEEGGLTSVT